MNKRTLIEAIIGVLLLVVELIVVLVRIASPAYALYTSLDSYLMYLLVIFTNIDVIYGVILLIVNSNKKD